MSYPMRALNGLATDNGRAITFEVPSGDWAYVSPVTVLDAAHVAALDGLTTGAGIAHEWLMGWCRAWPVPTMGDVLEYADTHYLGAGREVRHAVAQALLDVLLDASTGCYVVR